MFSDCGLRCAAQTWGVRYRVVLALLLASIAANLILVAIWVGVGQPKTIYRLDPPERRTVFTNILRPIRTNLIVQPHLLSWRDIESDDYFTYIDNLRAIGCPEATVRDIIVADVNTLFARRQATEIVTTDQQWWREDPDPDVIEQAIATRDALEIARRNLLTQLLGPGWEMSGAALESPNSGVPLDGPLLGDLSPTTREAVRDAERRNREQRRAHVQARREQGKEADPAELARLRRETREELARILSPAQLEEYLLRYSDNAQALRRTLNAFDTSPEEFRALFRATDPLDLELAALQGASDPAAIRRRQELDQKRDEAVKTALGTERATFYRLSQDPVFRAARTTAEDLGAPAETVVPLYEINQETERERRRILSTPGLTAEQQSQELANIDQLRLRSLRRILGEDRFRRWQLGSGH